jgi:hypothetical protein
MRRRTVVVSGIAALAVAAAVLGFALSQGTDTPGPPAAAPPPVANLIVPVAPAVSVPTTPKPTPTKAAVPHEAVTSAVPTGFQISGKAFTINAKVCEMAYIRPLDPPGDQRHTVCWVKSEFGVAPGTNSGGTSYILGHSWAEAPLVLNPLSIFAMKQVNRAHPVMQSGIPTYPIAGLKGYVITLTTTKGTLKYTVSDAYSVSKEQAGNVAPLMATNTPNRVVIITCGVYNGQDVDENIIVDAYLTSSSTTHRA